MKVLKFGGSSVGSVPSILSVKQIVESIDDQVIVVVSALGGITDKLIETSRLAVKGNLSYKEGMTEIIHRHMEMVHTVIPYCKNRRILIERLNTLFEELQSSYDSVFASHELSAETAATIVSYGERLSSLIVSCLIKGSSWFDSRNFIKTEKKHNKYNLDSELTTRLVRENLCHRPKVSLVPGFISTDKNTGEVTNLGRGGSDYTASIIASALNADCLEIWTDVDGFMTADPRVISAAHPIDELSYDEAIELCNYGAKVIYPPTIHPVCSKNIPILIKNTMHPEAPGTVIRRKIHPLSNAIKGISSIKNTSLISIDGLPKGTADEISRQIAESMSAQMIEIFWFTKTEGSADICFGIHPEDEEAAILLLNQILSVNDNLSEVKEHIHLEQNLSMITVVGEILSSSLTGNVFFNALVQQEVHIIASAQGNADHNLSFLTENCSLCKAMHVTHEYFFPKEFPISKAS